MDITRTAREQALRRRRKGRWIKVAAFPTLLLATAVLSVLTLNHVQNQSGGNIPQNSPAPIEPSKQETKEVTLHFVGDVMLSDKVEDLLEQKGYDYPYLYVKTLFQQDDLTIANLETPVTERGTPAANKQFVYKSSPAGLPPMKAAGVDLVNLANNHSMDQGTEGLSDTFQHLTDQQIAFVGAGMNADQAYAPVMIERNGITMAVFGFSRVVPEVSWYAGANKPGVAASYDPQRAAEAIREARDKADIIIVLAHWGQEKVDHPVDHQISLAHAYIDAGADLVVGCHPHVLQGFEAYKGKWIAYSLGNFIFSRAVQPKTWESMVLQAQCSQNGGCRLTMLPYHAELGQAVPMDETDGAKLIKRVESISRDVQIDLSGRVQQRM
ncbi:CapA family protein [Brevibacillus fulvus]|uniref:Poly-gamma-glutamate synthesis protein (Capsule biosynthesis protein) n=1 Tax=Brevibacillus fulvus TaxID=1125967 RepID=A0A938Y2A3_9BACL|nr:CapA family protein [Brevibacillus fulvus]MBM7590661.1 poly-gamma-glutamate synthesis protein (capsule biosynthesis protein) [Brevibacillus fulvus]